MHMVLRGLTMEVSRALGRLGRSGRIRASGNSNHLV